MGGRVLAGTPCPPQMESASPTACPAGDAEADWLARSNGPGVVWYHDFRNDDEVNQFRWAGGLGNDPGNRNTRRGHVRRITSDGVSGGGCLEILRESGSGDPAVWWRQFSPLTGNSNGRGQNDPGADGTLPPQAFSPSNGGGQTQAWHRESRPGFYGHPSYHNGTDYDGSEFFLQMRVKMDPRRAANGNTQVGKLSYISATSQSLTDQEIVTYSGFMRSFGVGQPNYHRMYAVNFSPIENRDSLNRPGSQVGSDRNNYGNGDYCNFGPDNLDPCWAYSGGWDTLLYHITPGREGSEESRVVVYAARQGETSYTKIWDLVMSFPFENQAPDGASLPQGWNALILSAYQNGQQNGEFYHRYDQIIFSKQFIPCPQV